MADPIPRLEEEILLAHVLGVNRAALYARTDQTLTPEQEKLYQSYIDRYKKHEPIAYIVGFQPFYGLDFEVNSSVLIPRPETEKLVEVALDLQPATAADIGTGSGCITVTLAKHLPGTKVFGVDSSEAALKVAERNAAKHQVQDHCQFLLGNLLEPLKEKVDLIISNPPYIPTADIKTLEPNVKDWEPRQALDGGPDGLDYIRQIIQESPKHLKPGGCLVLEFGFGQDAEIKKIAGQKFQDIKIIKDNSDIERILLAR
ncbi:MAG: peptide chain release factor N(5)-glutamine methyltransferase [bacterium]